MYIGECTEHLHDLQSNQSMLLANMYNAQLSLMHGTYKETHTLKLYKPKWFPTTTGR